MVCGRRKQRGESRDETDGYGEVCTSIFAESDFKIQIIGGLLVVGLGGASWVLRLRAMPVARIPRA